MLYLYNMPIAVVARTDKFTRGRLLAQSLRLQKSMLNAVKMSILYGKIRMAKIQMEAWKKERKAYKIALSWQSV